MTTVVPFTQARAPARSMRREEESSGSGAEIVIFPGVRIECYQDELDLLMRALDAAGKRGADGRVFGGPGG